MRRLLPAVFGSGQKSSLHAILVMACLPQDSASTPIAALGAAVSSGLQMATQNAGMDHKNCFSTCYHGAMVKLATAIFELAKTCHIIGNNELRAHHVHSLRRYLADLDLPVEIKASGCTDAHVWHPSLIQHLSIVSMKTVPLRNSLYSGGRELVEARFGTVDGEAEWMVALNHMRSGSTESGNMLPGKAPGKMAQQKQQRVRHAMFASGQEFSNLVIGCVLLGDFNLKLA